MPRRSRNPRRRQNRRKRYAGRRRPRQVNVNRALAPFAQRYITKLKYTENFTMPTAVGGIQVYSFNMNSLFNPNRVATPPTPHQPYGYDQLTPVYNRYRVISCSYTIKCISSTQTVNVVALPANQAFFPPSAGTAMESPRAKFITQNPGGNLKTLWGRTYIPSLMGRNKAQYMADDNYQALTTASPAELAVLNIYAQGIQDGAVDPSTLLSITLEFTAEFFDVKQLAAS